MRLDLSKPRCYHCGKTFGSYEPWKGKDGRLYCDWHCEKACNGSDEGHNIRVELALQERQAKQSALGPSPAPGPR